MIAINPDYGREDDPMSEMEKTTQLFQDTARSYQFGDILDVITDFEFAKFYPDGQEVLYMNGKKGVVNHSFIDENAKIFYDELDRREKEYYASHGSPSFNPPISELLYNALPHDLEGRVRLDSLQAIDEREQEVYLNGCTKEEPLGTHYVQTLSRIKLVTMKDEIEGDGELLSEEFGAEILENTLGEYVKELNARERDYRKSS